MKKHEILQLQKEHPALMERALAMEARAQSGLDSVKGLGRRFSWADFLKADGEQQRLFKEQQSEVPCGCYDGDSE